ncbi:signal peptide peptidase SppA [Succinatimonas hippei]|uniref:signal peptide peptidase SppA n=1 Tax=Succinatimonas hippei TaxID=626938 RepID=UPI0023F9C4F6|nr:signal peptide peptidase SppA [Succinatimonas hippei]
MGNSNTQIEIKEVSATKHTSWCRGFFKVLSFIGAALTFIRNFISNLVMIAIIALIVIAYNLAGTIKEKAVIIASSQEEITTVEQSAQILYLPLKGVISESPLASDDFSNLQRRINEQLTGSVTHELIAIEKALNFAAEDNNLKLIILDLNDLSPMSLAVAKRIGNAVDKVRNAGKEVTALAYSYSQSAFAIAAHCDKILLDPMGQVNLRGIGMSSLYYKDLLNTLKVTPYIFKAGHFKSAVEPYTRNDMSPDVKAEYANLAANLWDEYIKELNVRKVLSRTIVLPDADKYVKELELYKGDTALMQLENNLVDELISREDYLLSLCKDYGTDKSDTTLPNMINYRKYLALKSTPEKLKDKRIAVIYGIGQISGFSNDVYAFTPDNILPLLNEVRNDDKIKAVVMYINSPGGAVKASEEIRRELMRLKELGKKVIVSMNGTAASGGYWVASAADQIIADSSTLTGSIGVFSLALGAHDLLNHVGVYQDGVATHEFADASIANPLSENTKETMRLSVEHTYDTFINLVAKSRRLSPANYISYAEGQVFLGDEAQNLGLIDDLGSLNDALNTAAKLIDSTLDDVSVLHLAPQGEKSISPLELFIMNKAEGIIPNELLKGFIDLAVKSHEGSENNAQYIALSPIKAEL